MIDICKRLNEAYSNPVIRRTSGRRGVYPSEASIEVNGEIVGACHREAYFDWFGYEEEGAVNPDSILAAEMGNWMHDGLVESYRARPIETGLTVLSAEQPFFNKDELISGRTDIFMMDNASGEIFGVDIKSVGEWAGKKCYLQPKLDHIIQCALYLWEYQNTARQGKREINKWIILYISRDENWDLKKNIHGSLFKYLWQFTVSFEDEHVVVQNQAGVVTKYKDITTEGIIKRYRIFLDHVKNKNLPERDFEAQYSEEKIVGMYELGTLPFKKDIAAVEKWMKKGAAEGQLNMSIGDDACFFCRHKGKCYSEDPLSYPKEERILYDLPQGRATQASDADMF
jgi:hypothetical protein